MCLDFEPSGVPRKSMQKGHRQDLNQEYSYCEATLLITSNYNNKSYNNNWNNNKKKSRWHVVKEGGCGQPK